MEGKVMRGRGVPLRRSMGNIGHILQHVVAQYRPHLQHPFLVMGWGPREGGRIWTIINCIPCTPGFLVSHFSADIPHIC